MTGYAGAVAKFRYDTSSKEIEPSDLMVILHVPFRRPFNSSDSHLMEVELKGSGESDLIHFRGSLYSDVEIIHNEYTFESESIEVNNFGVNTKYISGVVKLTMSLTFTHNDMFQRLLIKSFSEGKTIDIGIYSEGPKELQMYHLYVASLNVFSG